MAGLLIKNLPPLVHRRLKETASRHRRSMTREALVILEEALGVSVAPGRLPAPYHGSIPLTKRIIDKAKRTGRE